MIGRIRLIRALAALIVGAAGGTVVTIGAAYASACPAGTGVTVVVGSSVGCDRNGGGSAASNAQEAGHSVSNYRGFVCSVDGSPDPAKACHSYAPANAYWGLFWSNGKSGKWAYSSSGAYGLKVPTGGWVGLKFQTSTSTSYPGVTPLTAPPAPKPRPKPTSHGPKPSATSTATASESAKSGKTSRGGKPGKSRTPEKAGERSVTPTDGATATTQPDDDLTKTSQETGGSSSLGWIAGALAIVLIGGMGTVAWRRRTAGGRTP
jgi:hypothetical protein